METRNAQSEALIVPASYTQGTLGRNVFEGPQVGERMRVQIRLVGTANSHMLLVARFQF
ncbi:MAG: hypothetical protein HY820_22095 [Acidobacteria bacterium]|nr:hypothetical protein [Acidobacteriota bacterium]